MDTTDNIDRVLDPPIIRQRRRQRLRRWSAVVGVAVVAFIFLRGWISPSVDRDALRTAVAEIGPVEATITAAGVVLPDDERVITAPFDTRIVSILKHAGGKLTKGEPILVLDTNEAHLALERINDNLTVKENELSQQALELGSSQSDLTSRRRIEELRGELFATKARQQQELFALGGASQGQVAQAELEERIAAIELERLDSLASSAERVSQSKLASLKTEITLLQKEQREMRRLLSLATTRAEHDGVVTWVVDQVGIAVHKSDPIAKISNLASFRIEATVSEIHAGKLAPGLPIHVRINDSLLEGTVTTINPTIQSGVITLSAALNNPNDPRLHSHLRVDVYIVTAQRASAMRIKRGQITESQGSQPIFLLRDGHAVRTEVQVGLVGYDFAEILDGLTVGDSVITSSMKEYVHLSKIRIQ